MIIYHITCCIPLYTNFQTSIIPEALLNHTHSLRYSNDYRLSMFASWCAHPRKSRVLYLAFIASYNTKYANKGLPGEGKCLWEMSRVNTTTDRRSNRVAAVFPVVIIHVPAPVHMKRTRSIDPVKTETRTTTPLRDKYPVMAFNGPESHSSGQRGGLIIIVTLGPLALQPIFDLYT